MGLAKLKKPDVKRLRSSEIKNIENYMETITVNLKDRSYPVYVGSKIINKTGEILNNFEISRRVAILSNPTVWKFYGPKIIKTLKSAGFLPVKIIIPDGEKYKNLRTVEKIYTEMLKAGIDRKGCVVALGGGVIGDIAGFVSATYMRGIKFVQVPTTLLAEVDASIGGKTGVDHKFGKNLIGAFHQPLFVLSDINLLKTLPEREYRAGLAEVIKYGIIRDAQLFEFMEKEREKVIARDDSALTDIVRRCSEIKAEIVERDEREETGLRSILNFGHTIGHAIEASTGYKKYLHGEAVAMGMVVEAGISDSLTNQNNSQRISQLIHRYFNVRGHEILLKNILDYIKHDKKTFQQWIKVFLIKNIGEVIVDKIEVKKLQKLINQEVKL